MPVFPLRAFACNASILPLGEHTDLLAVPVPRRALQHELCFSVGVALIPTLRPFEPLQTCSPLEWQSDRSRRSLSMRRRPCSWSARLLGHSSSGVPAVHKYPVTYHLDDILSNHTTRGCEISSRTRTSALPVMRFGYVVPSSKPAAFLAASDASQGWWMYFFGSLATSGTHFAT